MTTATGALTGLQRMRYETPHSGITITGYIARRMQKTRLLEGIREAIGTDPRAALAQFGLYAIAAGTSFGPALYQPAFDPPGSQVRERDPETGAVINVLQGERNPHYTFRFSVRLPDGDRVTGQEFITGTTVGLRGLGMPAPSTFNFNSATGGYRAEVYGVIHSELAPGWGRWQVRGYGELTLTDNTGNHGRLVLDRRGRAEAEVEAPDGEVYRSAFKLT
jgi:hypothetical protein